MCVCVCVQSNFTFYEFHPVFIKWFVCYNVWPHTNLGIGFFFVLFCFLLRIKFHVIRVLRIVRVYVCDHKLMKKRYIMNLCRITQTKKKEKRIRKEN